MMNKDVVDFPNRSVIDEEAASWLMRLDRDQRPSAEEKAALGAWLGRSRVHRESITELARLWDRMNVLTELAVPLGEVPKAKRHGGMTGRRWAVASFAVAVTLIASVAWLARDVWWGNPMADTNGLYATAVGQQQETVLADGSVVQLNTNSQIRVEYGEKLRDIRLLQGEAHFTVVENEDLPFRVFAGNGRVQAVGTAFAVHLTESGVDVTVTDGKVSIAAVGQAGQLTALPGEAELARAEGQAANLPLAMEDLGVLTAGERAVIAVPRDIDVTSPVLQRDEANTEASIARQLSWREGVLMFNGEPLSEALGEISRYTTLTFEIADPEIRDRPVGGRYPIGENELMLRSLESNFGLRVTRLGHDRVLLSVAE